MCSANTVIQPIVPYGQTLTNPSSVKPKTAFIELLYSRGIPVSSLSFLFNRSQSGIYLMLQHHGVDKRPRRGMKGSAHPNWKGDQPMHPDNGNQRARAWFDLDCPCERCHEKPATDRHHIDGDSFNNVLSNIQKLCRKCHQTVDGRLDNLRKISLAYVKSIKGKPNPGRWSELGNKYAQLYQSGMTSTQIAKQFNISPNSVLMALQRRGVKIRPQTRSRPF